MQMAHDDIGHKGLRSLRGHLGLRFWWPFMTDDLTWYMKTCHECQQQQTRKILIPPTVQQPARLFGKAYCDTMLMPLSKTPRAGYRYIAQARCSLTHYPEWAMFRKENSKNLSEFVFGIICRWGALHEIVTDNGPPWVKAVSELATRYQINYIRISGYNSRANGVVEQSHLGVRESIVKASADNIGQWPMVVASVFWAERITFNSITGMSPYYMAHGTHPCLPLDLVEATFLTDPPDKILSTEELIGQRARQLQRREADLADIHRRVVSAREVSAGRFRKKHAHVIRDYNFIPGALVLKRNSNNDGPLRDKTEHRYLGPYLVLRRTQGGSYIIAELNGVIGRYSVAAFRLIPYHARRDMVTAVQHLLKQYASLNYEIIEPEDNNRPTSEPESDDSLQ